MTDDQGVHEERVENEQPDGMAPLRTLDGQTIYELPYRREGSTVHLGWSTATELAEVRAAAERAAARDLYSRMELGKTQRGLAASQADLTRVEAERNELLTALREANDARTGLIVLSDQLSQRLTERGERLTSALAELEQLRRQQVARQDVGDCGRCGQLITRGYAVEPMPGTTKGTWQHSQCPETKGL